MTYKWTLDEIDRLTWPTMKGLLEMIKDHPPSDLVVSGLLKALEPKPLAQQAAGLGVRKGKVRKR